MNIDITWWSQINMDLELLRTIFAGATPISVLIAFMVLRTNKKKQNEDRDISYDKEIITQAIKSLEWGFASLTIDKSSNMPHPVRLNWLTSARHILRYNKLRDTVKTNTYKIICAEHEEYWRHKFYLLFKNNNFMFGSYFTNSDKPKYPENIELRSAMVLSIFSQWNNETSDPILELDEAALIDQKPFKGDLGTGIEHYYNILSDAKNAPPD